MIGTLVNTGAVIVGALLGLLLKKGLPERIADTVMKGLGLCTLYLGITGVLKGQNSLVIILSVVIGASLGEGLDLEEKVNRIGGWLERRCRPKADKGIHSVAQGFVTASLLFCVGAMAIVGSLQSGLTGNHEMIFNKSVLDFVAAIIFASSLGYGVIFSAAFVFVYQGSIVLLAQWVAPFLTETVVNEMTCVGSLIIIGLAFNMIGITKLKVMNYVPAVFMPIFLYLFF